MTHFLHYYANYCAENGYRSRVQLKRRRSQKKKEIVKIKPYFISLLLIKKVYKRKMVIYRDTTEKKVKFQEFSILEDPFYFCATRQIQRNFICHFSAPGEQLHIEQRLEEYYPGLP